MRILVTVGLCLVLFMTPALALNAWNIFGFEVTIQNLDDREVDLMIKAMGNYAEADASEVYQTILGKIQSFIKVFPESGSLYTMEGVLYYTLGQYPEALASFDNAEKYQWSPMPQDAADTEESEIAHGEYLTAYFRGVIFLAQERYAEAIAQFGYIIDVLAPQRAGWGEMYQVDNYMAYAYGMAGDLEKAYEYLLRVLDDPAMLADEYFGPQFDYAMENAYAVLDLGKPEALLSELNDILRDDPGHLAARMERAGMLQRAGAMSNFAAEMRVIDALSDHGEALDEALRADYEALTSLLEAR